MIKVRNSVPSVYYDHSRDFQLIGRLYEVVFNYLKTNVDSVYSYPLSALSNDDMLELMSLTLGFKSKHNYPLNQLRAICESFSLILKYKGSERSIKYTLNALLKAEHITAEASIKKDEDTSNLSIYIPSELKDLNLFKDLLVYILPAGMVCEIHTHALSEITYMDVSTSSDNYKIYSKVTTDTSQIIGYEGITMTLSDISNGRLDNTVVQPYVEEGE